MIIYPVFVNGIIVNCGIVNGIIFNGVIVSEIVGSIIAIGIKLNHSTDADSFGKSTRNYSKHIALKFQ